MKVALELGSRQRLEEFHREDGKSLDCFGRIVSCNMDDNNSASEDPGGSKEHGGENIRCLIEYLSHYKETADRNMDVSHFWSGLRKQ